MIEFEAKLPKVLIKGFLTKTVLSGSCSANKVTKDQTFCFLNNRPIDMPRKIKSLLGDMYKMYNPASQPYVIWNIQVEDENYDINVSPDKREVFIKNEPEVLEALKQKLA